jgi:hypothetical protein
LLRLAFAHQSTALRHQWQSAGQLHTLLGGVVSVRFSFGSFPRLRAHALGGLAAALSCSKVSPLGFNGGSGEEMVWSGDVRSRRVAVVQLRVSLQEVLQLSNRVTEVILSKKRSRILTGLGGFRAENNVGTYVLSIETHRRATTGNTRSREASGTAGGPRSLGQRPSDLGHTLAWSC